MTAPGGLAFSLHSAAHVAGLPKCLRCEGLGCPQRDKPDAPCSGSKIPRDVYGSFQNPWDNQRCPGDRVTVHQHSSHDNHKGREEQFLESRAGEIPCKPYKDVYTQNQERVTNRRPGKGAKDLTPGAGAVMEDCLVGSGLDEAVLKGSASQSPI